MTVTAYVRSEDLSGEDFVEQYQTFDTVEDAEQWVSNNLERRDTLDSYVLDTMTRGLTSQTQLCIVKSGRSGKSSWV